MFGDREIAATFVALNAADNAAPREIMLLPPGPVIATVDGRGPYRTGDLDQLAQKSLAAAGGKLAIDENHATDLAAPKGGAAPARGWITGLHARDGALYGDVEWTDAGRKLVAEREYRGISPVFTHAKDGTVTRLLRASLTNVPNLRGQAALHAQGDPMLQAILKALGLAPDADEAAVLKAIAALKAGSGKSMQAIAAAAGLKDDADDAAVLAAVSALAKGKTETKPATALASEELVALQAELTTVTKQLTTLQSALATERATAFVDGAIKEGRVGVKPLRERYIAMHAADPKATEELIAAMPKLGPSGALAAPPKVKDGKVALNAEQLAAARALGIKADDYAKTLAAEIAADEETA